jgi:hypothetical protein
MLVQESRLDMSSETRHSGLISRSLSESLSMGKSVPPARQCDIESTRASAPIRLTPRQGQSRTREVVGERRQRSAQRIRSVWKHDEVRAREQKFNVEAEASPRTGGRRADIKSAETVPAREAEAPV